MQLKSDFLGEEMKWNEINVRPDFPSDGKSIKEVAVGQYKDILTSCVWIQIELKLDHKNALIFNLDYLQLILSALK